MKRPAPAPAPAIDVDADSGWIKIHRKLLDWPWFKNPAVSQLWLYCLLKATHRPRRQLVGMKMVHLIPGQLVFGRVAAAGKTGLTVKKVRIALDSLVVNGCVKKGQEKGQHFTIITICNWELYQGDNVNKGRDKGQERAGSGPGQGRVRATNKNVKNKKKEEEQRSAALGSPPVESGERRMPLISPAVDLAQTWEDLLKLDRISRSEEKDGTDFEDLLSVAQDIEAGKLPPSARETLTTLAHQIGSRDPAPNSPLGMFLSEVGRMRIRQSRKN